MKNKLIPFLAAISFSVILFNACKKEQTKDVLDSQTAQFTTDANSVKSENDQVNSDVNNSLSSVPSINGGRTESILNVPICGCTIDSSQISQKILYFNFDGTTNCLSNPRRTRGGQIKVQLTTGNVWSDPNAVLTLTFNNYKVTRVIDNYSVTFNGSKTLTNVNGTNWLTFWVLGTSNFVCRERALNIQVKFSDNSSAVWNSARLTTWSYVPSTAILTFSCNGDTTISSVANTDSWGTNRYGQAFQIYYNTPWVSNTYCGLWTPNSGEIVYSVNNANYTLTLGVDQNGNLSTATCAYGYKVTWPKSGGGTGSVVLGY